MLNDYENDAVEKYNERTYELMQEQCSWLAEVLKDCEEKELSVIIAAHEADESVIPGSNGKGFCQRTEPYPWSLPVPIDCHIAQNAKFVFLDRHLIDPRKTKSVIKRKITLINRSV